MSYSFNVIAGTKAEAKAKVAAKLAEVVAQQPIHALERDQAQATADAFIDLAPDRPEMDLSVSLHGSVGWSGTYPDAYEVTHISCGTSIGHCERKPA